MVKLKIRGSRRSLVAFTLLAIICIALILIFRNVLVLGIFVVLSAIIRFYQSKLELGFDISPSLVLAIIFSIKLGFWYGILILIFGGFIPGVLTGGFTQMSIFFLSLAMFIVYLGSLGLFGNDVTYGIVLILIQSSIGFVISMVSGDPTVTFSVFFGLGLNIVYLIVLNNIISLLLA
jgi:hypothetical protein